MADQRSVLELLYKVSREFATALDLKSVLTRVLFAAINNVGGERASIVVMDDAGRPVESAIVYGNQVRETTTIQMRDTIDRGLAGWVIRSRQGALVPDTSKDPRWLRREDDAVDRSGAKSAICVPLMAREKLVGVMTLVHPMPKAYNDEHLELMQAIADQAGVAVMNGRLFSDSQRQARVMTALAEGAVSMNTSLRVEQAYERIIAQIRQALQAETAVLGMIDPGSGDVIFRASGGPSADTIARKRIRAGEGIAGIVIREGRGVIVSNTNTEARLAAAEKSGGADKTLICAPIHAQGKVIGVLEAFNPASKAFDPDSMLVLTGLGSLAGTIVQNAQLFERLNVAHQRYRELFEDSIDPIVITDLKGHITEANRQSVQLSGFSADELRQLLIEQVHDINFEKTGRSFEKVSSGKSVVYESTLFDKHGGTRPVEIYARKVVFDEVESFQWILRDITERKELDALRDDLAAMIYHDLRSPLGNIVSSLEMLESLLTETDRESTESVMRIAHHSINRIQRLINSLLDINRMEQNQPIGERQSTQVEALIKEALEAVAPAAEGREQTLQMNLADETPNIYIDADMVRRVLINLIENGIKYTPAKGTIEVGASHEDGWVKFWIQDNGPGIPEGDRERIFDKFIRLKNKTRQSGLGVGLAFCKLAVQGHGGKIWVEGAPTGGSRFLFTMPVAK